MKTYYNEHYVSSTDGFPTVAKAGRIAASLGTDPVQGVEMTDPVAFRGETEEIVSLVHDEQYIRALRTGNPRELAETSGLAWTGETLGIAVAHSTGLVAAVDTALADSTTAGSLSSGLHHARRGSGMGYCSVNGLVVACTAAFRRGVERVLCLDIDDHCGGGTFSMLGDDPRFTQVDVSTSFTYDRYPAHGDHLRLPAHSTDYVARITEALEHAASLPGFDLIVVNAGMDPINAGVSVADVQERERLVRDFVGATPAVFALAGGYTWGGYSMDDIVSWHRMTIEEWASR
ncbi:MAG: hypothetical protein ACKORY_01480 [Actinomycetota bacterium]